MDIRLRKANQLYLYSLVINNNINDIHGNGNLDVSKLDYNCYYENGERVRSVEVPLLPLKLPEEQSILIVGALILKIQAWTFFVVLGIVHKLYFID